MQEIFEGTVATITINVIENGSHTTANINTTTTRLSTHPTVAPTVTNPATGVYKLKFSSLSPALSVSDNDDGVSCEVNGDIGGTAWSAYHVPLKVAANMRGTDNASTHSAVDVVTALQAVANDFKADISALASQASVDTIDGIVDAIKAKTDQLTFTVANQVDSNALSGGGGGGGASAADIYTYFTDGTREDAFKADVSGLATQTSVDSIDTDVQNIGSDVSAILTDTNELQLNQGNWVTATGFSTHSSSDVISGLQAVSGDFKADVSSLLTTAAYSGSLPANFAELLIGTGADLGKVTTSNPAAGSGSSHTAADVAALILETPANKLVTNATGQVEASNMRGTDGANTVAPVDVSASVAAILADTNELQNNQNNWLTATGFSTHDAAAVVTAMQAVANDFKADVSGIDGGASASDIYTYFTDGTREDAFKADVSGLSGGGGSVDFTVQDIVDGVWDEAYADHTIGGSFGEAIGGFTSGTGIGSGIHAVTVLVQDSSLAAVPNARVSVDGTTLELVTSSSGTVTFMLDSGVYTLRCAPPEGYDSPADEVITVTTSDLNSTFTISQTSVPSSPSSVPWIG